MYIATTQGLKYDFMVISKTKKQAWRELKKYWESDNNWHNTNIPIPFEEACEYYGFYVSDKKIVLNKPFEI